MNRAERHTLINDAGAELTVQWIGAHPLIVINRHRENAKTFLFDSPEQIERLREELYDITRHWKEEIESIMEDSNEGSN
jgi:predicted GNAT superfamily acetyltransferase